MDIKKRKYLFLLVCLFTISISSFAISARAVHVGHNVSVEARKTFILWDLFGFSLDVSGGGETSTQYIQGVGLISYFTSHFHYPTPAGTPGYESFYLRRSYRWQLFSATTSDFRIRGLLVSFIYTVSGRFYEKNNPNDYCDVIIWIRIEADDSFDSNDWNVILDLDHLSDLHKWSFVINDD